MVESTMCQMSSVNDRRCRHLKSLEGLDYREYQIDVCDDRILSIEEVEDVRASCHMVRHMSRPVSVRKRN